MKNYLPRDVPLEGVVSRLDRKTNCHAKCTPHKDDIGGHFSRARDVLDRNLVHLDEAANGVSLPKNVATSTGYGRELGVPHSRIHNRDYPEALADRLEAAETSGKDLRDELQKIAQELTDPQSDWPPGKVRW